jgi:hypothetical protein
MTQREKVLATGLAVVLGLAASAGLLFFFVLEPIKSASERVQTAQAFLDQKQGEWNREQTQIGNMLKVNPRLAQWHEISLPPRPPEAKKGAPVSDEQKRKHLARLQVDYERYLNDLLRKDKRFQSDSIVINTRQVEKQTTTARGKQQPLYERLAFSVAARGDLKGVTSMLEEFHRTPLLHQIRSMTVDLASSKTGTKKDDTEALDLKMTVEALLVNGAKDRASLLPEKLPYPLKVLAEPERTYALMTKKNMFTGIKPPPVVVRKTEKKDPPKPRPKEDRADVLRFVKLTMLWYNDRRERWEATVYDQAKGGQEKKLNTGLDREFTIYDKYDEVSLDARVIHVDEDQLIFRSEGKYYRLRCGDFVYPAIRESLRETDLKKLGIKP